MEDFCVLYTDLKSDHDCLFDCIRIHGRAGLAAIYERLHADDDICGHTFHPGTFWRRIPKAHVIGKRAVSSYAMPGVVSYFLYIMGRPFVSMDGSGGDHICVRDRDDVHELQRVVRWAISVFQGESSEQDGYGPVDSGTDGDDLSDRVYGAADCVRGHLTSEVEWPRQGGKEVI